MDSLDGWFINYVTHPYHTTVVNCLCRIPGELIHFLLVDQTRTTYAFATNPVKHLKTSSGSGVVALEASAAESSTWQSLTLCIGRRKSATDKIREIWTFGDFDGERAAEKACFVTRKMANCASISSYRESLTRRPNCYILMRITVWSFGYML